MSRRGRPLPPESEVSSVRAKKALIALAILAVIAASALALWLWPLIHGMVGNPFTTERFDRAKWMAAESGPEWRHPRGPMAEDIGRRLLHTAMRRADVRALLGGSSNSEHDEQQGNVDRYYLGVWSYMSIDGDYLIVHYDRTGKVTSTEIYTH